MSEVINEQIELVEQDELDEITAKNKLLEVLNKPNTLGQIPELITCRSSVTERASKYESNFGFYKIFEPIIANAKTLELFCGFNTGKQYLKQNDLPGEVTGVDIENEAADIKTDVAKLQEILRPNGQFDIVTSIGAHPGFESFADDAAYLKEDGLYVHGLDEEWLDDKLKVSILAWANDEQDKIEDPNVKEISKHFQIAAILKLNGVRQVVDWPDTEKNEAVSNEYYFICKKAKRI